MRNLLIRFLFSAWIPLLSFVMYWSILAQGDAYNETNLTWGALVTIILTIAMYLHQPLGEKVEQFSPAWGLGIGIGGGLFVFGIVIFFSEGASDLYRAWGIYIWFFALGELHPYISAPKEHKPHEGAFWERQRPTEDASD